MDLMERIPVKNWSLLSYEEKHKKITAIRVLREICRIEVPVPVKKTRAPAKKKTKTKTLQTKAMKNTQALMKLLKKLPPGALEELKETYKE